MIKKLLCLLIALSFNLSIMAYAEQVYYNPQTKIYHSATCRYVSRCKKCIKIDIKQARQRGGRACKVCGG